MKITEFLHSSSVFCLMFVIVQEIYLSDTDVEWLCWMKRQNFQMNKIFAVFLLLSLLVSSFEAFSCLSTSRKSIVDAGRKITISRASATSLTSSCVVVSWWKFAIFELHRIQLILIFQSQFFELTERKSEMKEIKVQKRTSCMTSCCWDYTKFY